MDSPRYGTRSSESARNRRSGRLSAGRLVPNARPITRVPEPRGATSPNAGSGARQNAVAKSAGGSAAWFAGPGPQAAVDAGLGFCFGEAEVGGGVEELVCDLGGVEF